MRHTAALRNLTQRVFVTFKRTRCLLYILVVVCVIPGTFVVWLPFPLRLAFTYMFAGLTALALTFAALSFANMVRAMPAVFLAGRGTTKEFEPPEAREIARRMKIRKLPKFLLQGGTGEVGPSTNGFTRTIRLPRQWMEQLHRSEFLAALGHELGHLRARRRFWIDYLVMSGVVVGLTVPLALHTIPLIVNVFDVALVLLLATSVSWRNEFRADRECAKVLGPEGLISLLELLEAKYGPDEGSVTHPPLRTRIDRLMKLLDSQ